MKLSIAIVSWNTLNLLDQCLLSVYETLDEIPSEVIVVDNDSRDGSPDMVRANYQQAQLIQMSANVGFAAANNAAYRVCSGEYFLLLNSDTIVHTGAFEAMVDFLDTHPEAGAVGCRLLNGDGTLQRSCSPFPTPLSEFFDAAYLSKLFPRSRLFGQYAMSYESFDNVMEVDFAGGSSLLLRKTALEQVGLLDEGYFMYSEEADLCYRMKKAGWKVCFTPDGVVTHLGGQSARLNVKANLIELYRSKHRFMMKHYGIVSATAYRLVVGLSAAARITAWSAKAIAGRDHEAFKEKTHIQRRLLEWAARG